MSRRRTRRRGPARSYPRRRIRLWEVVIAAGFGLALFVVGLASMLVDLGIDSTSVTGTVMDVRRGVRGPDEATVEFFVGERRVLATVGVGRRLHPGEQVLVVYDTDDPEVARVADDHSERDQGWMALGTGVLLLGWSGWTWRKRLRRRRPVSKGAGGSGHDTG